MLNQILHILVWHFLYIHKILIHGAWICGYDKTFSWTNFMFDKLIDGNMDTGVQKHPETK